MILVCGRDRSHKGYRRGKTLVESFKAGVAMPIELANMIEKKLGGTRMESTALTSMKPEQMLARIDQARFPQDLTLADKKTLAKVAIDYGLDPLMGELMIYQGRPYVTIDGRRRKAQETDLFDGIQTRPATKEERTAWGIPDGDHFFHADVFKKECSHSFEGWGRVTKEQIERAEKGARSHGKDPWYLPLVQDPQGMAEKRAEAKGLRKAFSIPLPSAEDIGSENGAIEGQYRVVDVKTGEIREEAEPFPQVEGTPSEDATLPWLKVCPEHNVQWQRDKFQNLSHKQGDYYCKAKGVFRQYFDQQCESRGWGKEDSLHINNWLKDPKHFGTTWSQLSEEAMLEAIEQMRQEADHLKPVEFACPKCATWLSKANPLDERDIKCGGCGTIIHFQGATPWIDQQAEVQEKAQESAQMPLDG